MSEPAQVLFARHAESCSKPLPKTASVTPPGRRFAAFISYSHAADGKLAPALQGALQRFAKPWYRLRALTVFRDQTSLSASPSLWTSIERSLAASEHFVLMASPTAAQSQWVARELSYWLANRDKQKLLIVVTDGELVWDEANRDFLWNDTTPLPQTLRGAFPDEPKFLDLRWARDPAEHLSLSNNRFREAVADLAATLHGKPKEDLIGEEVREHRKTQWMVRGFVTALLATTLLALYQRHVAEANAQEYKRLCEDVVKQVKLGRKKIADLKTNEFGSLIADVADHVAQLPDVEKWKCTLNGE